MKKQQHREEEIFIQALEIDPGSTREAYLDEACGGDAALREKVGKLVEGHEEPAGILGALGNMVTPAAAGEHAGDQIGNYKLLEKIGEGGMGVVYMAEQEKPVRRKVALKIIKLGMDTKQVVARFEAERQALAMMDSPHIAKLLDAGVTQTGRPYFVMELVRGIAITKFCQDNRIPIEDRLKLFITVCQAIQHAHQKGVIHRDIKPSNILVTRNGGVPHPMVIDFGVAKAINQRLTEKTLFTNFAQMIGTPTYMSPEQAEMSIEDIDTRSDVYSLGVLLYELMTGTTPFPAERLRSVGYAEMQRIILEEEPLRPSTMVSQMADQGRGSLTNANLEQITSIKAFKGDLDWIVLKAIEKDRKMRYETANGLAMDVRRHLDDEPVEAAAPTVGYRFRKYARRHKAAVLAGVAIAAALLVGTGVSVWQAVEADLARQREFGQRTAADDARIRAEAGERRAREGARHQRQFAYASDMKAAEIALAEDHLGRASALLERYLPIPGENAEDLRGIEWRYLWQASRGDEIASFPHNSIVASVSLSDDGTRLATGTWGGEIQLFDLDSRVQQKSFEAPPGYRSPARASALSPDGRLLAAEKEGNLVVWDAKSGAVVFETEKAIAPVAFSPDSGTLAARTKEGISLWDTRTWQHRAIEHPVGDYNNAITFTPDGTRIALKYSNAVRVWNLENGEVEREFIATAGLLSAAVSSKFVAAGTGGGQIFLWDLESGESLGEPFLAHLSRVDALAFSPDGRTLATGGNDAVIHLWSLDPLARTRTLRGHQSEIWDLRFSRDGQLLASASKDQTVKLWRTEAAPAVGASYVIPEKLFCRGLTESGDVLRFSHSEEWPKIRVTKEFTEVLKVAKPRTDHLFNTITGQWSQAIRSDGEATLGATSIAWLNRQDTVLFGKEDGTVVLSDGIMFESFRVAEDGVRVQPLLLSPKGRYLVVNVYPSEVESHAILWDRELEASVATFSPPFDTYHKGPKYAFSADERFLAFVCTAGGGDEDAVGLWNIPERRQWATLRGHTMGVSGLEFSPNGKLLASISFDATCRLWDVENGCAGEPHLLQGHRSGCYQATFTPDGRTLVTASDDTTYKFWSIATGQEMLSRKFTYSDMGHKHQAFPAMTPDANRLISLTGTGKVPVLEVIPLPSLAEIDAMVSKRAAAR